MNNNFGIRAFFKSFKYAFAGIFDFFSHHRNAQVELFAAIIAIGLGVYVQINKIEWIVVVFCIALVLALEAMNSAIEYLTDLVSPNIHPLAGKAKDMAAGAVLLAAIGAFIVGVIVFWPYLVK